MPGARAWPAIGQPIRARETVRAPVRPWRRSRKGWAKASTTAIGTDRQCASSSASGESCANCQHP